tara:strand:- start:1309 stop:1521 length:213 start_codon:yes stop_codon:yes gene_type:complete
MGILIENPIDLKRNTLRFMTWRIEMITLILFLTALNTILILYFHWQQEERNISFIKSFEELNEKIDDSKD